MHTNLSIFQMCLKKLPSIKDRGQIATDLPCLLTLDLDHLDFQFLTSYRHDLWIDATKIKVKDQAARKLSSLCRKLFARLTRILCSRIDMPLT